MWELAKLANKIMNIQKIIEKNRNAIVLVDVVIPGENNQNKMSIRGTGFIISTDGKFITNAHVYKTVVENELQYIGASVPGKTDNKNLMHYDRCHIKLLKIDEENDVALMQIVSEGSPSAGSGRTSFETIDGVGDSEKLKEGDEIVYIGYPLATEMLNMGFGITMTTNKCMVSSIKRRAADGTMHFFLVDTHTNNGSSGSPVFSVDSGKVIGIVSAKISSRIPTSNGQILDIPANIGICRPAKYIENILK